MLDINGLSDNIGLGKEMLTNKYYQEEVLIAQQRSSYAGLSNWSGYFTDLNEEYQKVFWEFEC